MMFSVDPVCDMMSDADSNLLLYGIITTTYQMLTMIYAVSVQAYTRSIPRGRMRAPSCSDCPIKPPGRRRYREALSEQALCLKL